MKEYYSMQRRIFLGFNYVFIGFISLICLSPIIHVLALSLSTASDAMTGRVLLWPLHPNLAAYDDILKNAQFLVSFWISCKVAVIGTAVSMTISLFAAYPLSKMYLKGRSIFAWFFLITMMFSGGLIPWYMTVRDTGLMDTFWALVIPSALHVFDILLLLNFFRNLPKELEEAAMIDGAGHWSILGRIYLPLSAPAIATVALLTAVGYWNSWFDGLVLINSPTRWPLQTFLQSLVVQFNPQFMTVQEADQMAKLSNTTLHSAEIFVAMVPIILIYPFLQRYFIHGITLGTLKE